MRDARETDDASYIAKAMEVFARATGMTELSRDESHESGLSYLQKSTCWRANPQIGISWVQTKFYI